MSLTIASIQSPADAQIPFRIKDVDSRFFGEQAIAVDTSGAPHVMYGSNRHAWRSGQVWVAEYFEPDVGFGISLHPDACAFDSAGTLHAAYMKIDSLGVRRIRYARKGGGGWTREEVASLPISTPVNYMPTAISLRGDGEPVIAWVANYEPPLTSSAFVATRASGSWAQDTLITGLAGPLSIVMAVEGDGTPHVLLNDSENPETPANLRYARRVGSSWQIESVDQVGGAIVSSGYGTAMSIAVDSKGSAHITYYDPAGGDLRYAQRTESGWTREYVDTQGVVGSISSLALDSSERPHVAYREGSYNGGLVVSLKYATRLNTGWAPQPVDSVAIYTCSLALDRSDQPRIAYSSNVRGLRVATGGASALESELLRPVGGETWFVGATDSVSWSGSDDFDVDLSLDGGFTWTRLASDLQSSPYVFQIPHVPTRFAKVRLTPTSGDVIGVLTSADFFTIDATIALAKFDATRNAGGNGTLLTWETQPGPEADIRYRVERAGNDAAFVPLATGLNRGEFLDLAPASSSRYRLIAVNGLGEEYVLGETTVAAALSADRDILAYPNPASGPIEILYRVAVEREVDLAVYDVSGRRIRGLIAGRVGVGVQNVPWDRRNDNGESVSAGVYFLRLRVADAHEVSERVTVVR